MYPITVRVTWGKYTCLNSITELSIHGFSQIIGDVVWTGVGPEVTSLDGSIVNLIGGALILSLGESFSLKMFECFFNNFSLNREQVLGVLGFHIDYYLGYPSFGIQILQHVCCKD